MPSCLCPGSLTTIMTPTQWLAIPTEIRLTELPNLVTPRSDASEASTVYVNGKKIVIKQEEYQPPGSGEDPNSSTSSVYLYPVGNSLLATTPEAVQKLEFECSSSPGLKCLASTTSASTEVIIVKSKPKNPDYKVKNSTLATKRSKPVHFKLIRGKPGVKVFINMSYHGHIYGDEPVKRCKKHDECTWCKEHDYNQCFCVISKFHKYELDHKGQPRAVITVTEEHLDIEGSAEFSIVFSCWNSCDSHSKFGKELNLQIQIFDGFSPIRSTEYSIHCCQNLLRDAFKDKTRNTYPSATKRKQLSVPENNHEGSIKTPCKTGIETRFGDTDFSNNKTERPVDLVVEGLDAERRDIIERMVKIMGGSSFPIPHLTRLRDSDASDKEEHQSTLN
ncbi:uncharacterized protein LOC121860955 isoform X2 [Homarus americanus]|uniref:uncharacterized protein LOC121860955 isoform X2 n=1 Tax=Homarus americanus TaxID=6706 RepID=UPI001C484BC1|nr:uncharacterized protein LOC121860955 isoform X2 [Homarus americanus]